MQRQSSFRKMKGRGVFSRLDLRSFFLALSFLALAVQGAVVQAHVHVPELARLAVAADWASAEHTANAHQPDAPKPLPVNKASDNCALCQNFHQSNHFLAAGAAPLAAAMLFTKWRIVFTQAPLRLRTSFHSWQGRAPPLA
jgi:hypothetical protein